MSLTLAPRALELFNRCRKPAPRLFNAADAIYVYDVIGLGGVQAKDISDSLQAAKGPSLKVFINSPGGDYFEGKAIYSLLSRYAETHRVEAVVDGLAASAASLIAMAAPTVTMSPNSTMMIHEVQGMAAGRASDLEERARLIRAETGQMAAIYSRKTGLSVEHVSQMLAAETYMTAEEAVSSHFADRVSGSPTASASPDLSTLDHRILSLRVQALAGPAPKRTGPARTHVNS